MKNILYIIFILMISSCYSEPEIVFEGYPINVEADTIVKDGFLKVTVTFSPTKIIKGPSKETIIIEFHIMRKEVDIESIDVEINSIKNITFNKGNLFKVNATLVNGNYIEEIYSVQDVPVIKWAEKL